jgi:hypothetical protein
LHASQASPRQTLGEGDLGLVAVIYAEKRSEVVSAHARVGHQCLILTLLC